MSEEGEDRVRRELGEEAIEAGYVGELEPMIRLFSKKTRKTAT